MATRQPRIPTYRLHRPSGQAVVTLGGKDHYLGRHGSPESRAEYDRRIAEYLASRRQPPPDPAPAAGLTVTEMLLAVWKAAEEHYRHPDGTPTGELANLRDALQPLRELYGATAAAAFGPLGLRAVREAMVQAGLCRTTVNARVNRLRRAFRWAASLELIPVAVPQALATVAGLQRGRCAAPESPGVKPVAWQDVEATLPHLPAPVAAMVQLMRHTNCRAEDVVALRGRDLDRGGAVWTYAPPVHKTAWRGHHRVIHFGPRAQEVLKPFLGADPDAYLFSPRAALDQHHAGRRARRTTKRTPSEARRARQPRPRWAPRPHYSVGTFQQAVRRACRRAGVAAWSVLQVRHTRATEVRERFGVEGAAATLGHRRVETSQIYAEKNERLARDIAREIG